MYIFNKGGGGKKMKKLPIFPFLLLLISFIFINIIFDNGPIKARNNKDAIIWTHKENLLIKTH